MGKNEKNTERYEQVIREGIASLLTCREAYGVESSRYRAQNLQLRGDLYCYLLSLSKRYYEPYGLEIMEAAEIAIRHFNPENGDFLHYFNHIATAMVKFADAEAMGDTRRGGIRVRPNAMKRARQVEKYCAENQIVEPKPSDFEQISKQYGSGTLLDIRKYQSAYLEFKHTYIISENRYDEENHRDVRNREAVIRHWQGSDSYEAGGLPSTENKKEDVSVTCVKILQRIYDQSQEKTKPLKADLMTKYLCELKIVCGLTHKEYTFVNDDMISAFLEGQTLPTQEEIAQKHHTTAPNASQVFSRIEAEFKNALEEARAKG